MRCDSSKLLNILTMRCFRRQKRVSLRKKLRETLFLLFLSLCKNKRSTGSSHFCDFRGKQKIRANQKRSVSSAFHFVSATDGRMEHSGNQHSCIRGYGENVLLITNLGQTLIIWQPQPGETEKLIDTGSLLPGAYTMLLYDGNTLLHTQKLIVIK
jgi:hypothetical protein